MVDDLDTSGPEIGPLEADADTIVDPDRVLPGPIVRQRMEPVPGRHLQLVKRSGRIDHPALPAGCLEDVGREALRAHPLEDGSRHPVVEAPDRHPARRSVSLDDTCFTE
jgi:hypothetical protein